MRGQGIVEYALIGVLVAIVLIVILAVIGVGAQPQAPSPFSEDLRAVVERCAEGATSTTSFGNGITSESTNGDRLLRCLYDNGITVNYHGDLVTID